MGKKIESVSNKEDTDSCAVELGKNDASYIQQMKALLDSLIVDDEILSAIEAVEQRRESDVEISFSVKNGAGVGTHDLEKY